MRILSLSLVLLGLCTSFVSAAENNTPPEGFTALFNGKDLTNWKGLVGTPKDRAKMSTEQLAEAQAKADEKMKAHWKVEDGVLIYDGKGDSLATAKDYGNFEMYVDWKIKAKGDSGIYIRGLPQIQIWDTELKGGNGEEKGSGALWNNKKHERWPLVKADKPVGEWNTFYIKMVGDKVTVKLNDKLVTDNVVLENLWEPEKPCPTSGQIELQHHGNELNFRNIYIKELPSE
jgi:hypothetical protein